MTDAKNYSAQEILKNGLQVTIRAIRRMTGNAFLAAFKELDEKTVYCGSSDRSRKFSHRELKEATDVDFVRTVALVNLHSERRRRKDHRSRTLYCIWRCCTS